MGEEATSVVFIGGERGGVAGGDGAVAGGDIDVRALYGRGGRRPNRYVGCGPIRKEMDLEKKREGEKRERASACFHFFLPLLFPLFSKNFRKEEFKKN